MEKKLKGAIIGTGIFGSFQAKAFSQIPYVEITGICDLNMEKAKKVAAEFHIPEVYSDLHEMLKTCDCDFVSIATPDHVHAEAAIAAANAGKHILVEKPFATTREDALAMKAAIEKNGVRAMCDLHNRSSQPFAIAKQTIEEGSVGKVYSMYMRLNDNKSVATDMLAWSGESSILWFLGSHSLDILCYLCGSRPKTVYALSRKGILEKMGVDIVDVYQTSIEFENGCIAQMENGWIVPNGNTALIDLKCNIMCEKGMFQINGSNSDMLQVTTEERTTTPNCIARPVINGRVEGFAPNNIRAFTDGLYYGIPFNITVDEAVDSCLALLAIMESARTKQVVECVYE